MLNWDKYSVIAERFQRKVPYQERDDIQQEIILRLAEVDTKRNGKGPLSEAGMMRTASFVIKEYWRDLKRKPTILSLNNGKGDNDQNDHSPEFWETLADDNAIDVDSWLNADMWLRSCPKRLIEIAQRRIEGIALNANERQYLKRHKPKVKQMAFA
jgi:hypothetical protein